MRRLLALLVLVVAAARPGHGGDEASPEALVRALTGGEPWVREEAAARLVDLGPRALEALARARTGAGSDLWARLAVVEERILLAWALRHLPEDMVLVGGGTLPGAGEAEPTTLATFYLDATEVTVGAWRAWIAELEERAEEEGDTLPRRPPADWSDDLPMTGVTWSEADRYAREARGGRLPLFEELLWTACGASGRAWPWGPELLRQRANLLGHGPGALVPVGSYPRGRAPCGALDLAGNAAEWTATRVPYAGGLDHRHLLFGGSYRDPPDDGLLRRRITRRLTEDGYRRSDVGFRVARDVPPLPAAGAATDR